MIATRPLLRGLALLVAAGSAAGPAHAAEAAAKAEPVPALLSALLGVVLALLFAVGFGCALALLRVILPALARSADRSLEGLSTGRLFLTGLLPLLGGLLVSWALAQAGAPGALGLLVWVPLLLLTVAGAMAAVPHLGGRMLRSGPEASLLARAALGGGVAGLSLATWLLPPLGLLVSLLLGAWFLGVGLGLLARPSPAATPSA